MYDWANSAYNLVITSTIFPAYFESVTDSKVRFLGREFSNMSLYMYALAFAFFIVAIISPLLSSIADTRGNKKNFMAGFFTLGSLSCMALFFFTGDNLTLGVVATVLACIGYWASVVFYNSFLPEIAAPEDRDRVSAKGFAYGYVGSVILQVICFVFVFKPELLGGDDKSTIQFRTSFLLVGIWWFAFAFFSLKRLPISQPSIANPGGRAFAKGYEELRKVWKQLLQIRVLKRFLFALFFYNMGVQTVMLAATPYGKGELQIPTDNLIIAILLIQLIAIPGAMLIAKLSSRIGNIKTLMIVVSVWVVVCIAGYLLPVGGIYEFYGLAALVGFVMGGIQSLSRSTYSKLMPETRDTTSFFSFYDVTEKIAVVIGMLSFGYINELTGSQRNSVLALLAFFVIGLLLLVHTLRAKPGTNGVIRN